MAALNDVTIRNTIREVQSTGKQRKLADGTGRGTGRLVMRIRPMPHRILSEWYVQQVSAGKRQVVKIGSYPDMTLADARSRFAREYAPAIASKTPIREADAIQPGTVADLFTGYVASLKKREATSADLVEDELNAAKAVIGGTKLARDVKPADVLRVLRPIYDRGSPSMADHMRTYIRAAFSWGLKAELDYRTTAVRRFGLQQNPAADIPTEPKRTGHRWLTVDEFRTVYRWLDERQDTFGRALQLVMLTGCRVQEIARLTPEQWDPAEKLLDWSKTKNGKQHVIPVCDLAAELLNQLASDADRWLVPAELDPTEHVAHGTLYSVIWRERENIGVKPFSNRDLRRTWKTLAGQAGLSKEIRDRLQNHSMQGVSSVHYDRYEYMPEKREAAKKWGDWIAAQLG